MGLDTLFGKPAAANATSIKSLIELRLKRKEDRAPMSPGTLFRVSSLHDLCARREALRILHNVSDERIIEPDLLLTFALGTGMHLALQNEVLPALGILEGMWRCVECGLVAGEPERKHRHTREQIASRVVRPAQCASEACTSTEFTFKEYLFEDHELGLSGHPDGLLNLPSISFDPVIFEGKSIADSQTWKIKSTPMQDHVVQVHGYMLLTGLSHGVILYWIKGVHGVKALKEYVVERDERLIEQLKGFLASLRDGVVRGVAPEHKVCATPTCTKANSCSVREQCFDGYLVTPDGVSDLI